MTRRIISTLLFLFAFLSFAGVGAALAAPPAYIDPNTGGMLFQMLAVLFTMLSGLLFFFSSRIKMSFARFMRSLREKTGRQPIQEAAQENNPQQ